MLTISLGKMYDNYILDQSTLSKTESDKLKLRNYKPLNYSSITQNGRCHLVECAWHLFHLQCLWRILFLIAHIWRTYCHIAFSARAIISSQGVQHSHCDEHISYVPVRDKGTKYATISVQFLSGVAAGSYFREAAVGALLMTHVKHSTNAEQQCLSLSSKWENEGREAEASSFAPLPFGCLTVTLK